MSERRGIGLLVLLGLLAGCTKTAKSEDALEIKQETVAGYAISVPPGAVARIETTTPGQPSSRVFTADDVTIDVMMTERTSALAVKSMDDAIKTIPPAGMARPTERQELSPQDFLVVMAPAVGMAEVWMWRQGATRVARARCLGPDTKLARLKEICSSLRAID